MEYYKTLPGETCGGQCPDGCECERTMSTTLAVARQAYEKLFRAELAFTKAGLEVPFNWHPPPHDPLAATPLPTTAGGRRADLFSLPPPS